MKASEHVKLTLNVYRARLELAENAKDHSKALQFEGATMALETVWLELRNHDEGDEA